MHPESGRPRLCRMEKFLTRFLRGILPRFSHALTGRDKSVSTVPRMRRNCDVRLARSRKLRRTDSKSKRFVLSDYSEMEE